MQSHSERRHGQPRQVRRGGERQAGLRPQLPVAAGPGRQGDRRATSSASSTRSASSRRAPPSWPRTAQAEADKLSKVSVSIARAVGEEDKLFGSVTSRDIAEALREKGVTVDSKKIHLDEPIKALGDFEVAGEARTRRERDDQSLGRQKRSVSRDSSNRAPLARARRRRIARDVGAGGASARIRGRRRRGRRRTTSRPRSRCSGRCSSSRPRSTRSPPASATDDFFLPAHREIFEAMVAIDKRRQAIDVIAVADELKVHGMLARLDGGQSLPERSGQRRADGRERRCTTRAWCARSRRCGG